MLGDASLLAPVLNEFWINELSLQYGLSFDPPDRFEYYYGAGNPSCAGASFPGRNNAYYCAGDADEYVAFDVNWFTSYLANHPGGATTFVILAHEWGHAVQDTWVEQQPGTDTWTPPSRKELNADCLAGVWMADALQSGTVTEESGDANAIFSWLWENGGPWFDPGTHGTKAERQRAFADGFNNGTIFCRTNY